MVAFMSDLWSSALVGPLLGALAGCGCVLVWSAFFWEPAPTKEAEGLVTRNVFSSLLEMFELWQFAAAAIAGLSAWLVTGWLAAAIAAVVVVLAAPTHSSAARSEADFAERTEAVAGWVDALRDTMRGSRAIEGAIRVTAASAPLPIRPALLRMNRRVALGEPLREALADMADEYQNEVCDLVVSVLVNALGLSSAQIPSILDTIAEQARAQAFAHLQVHTSRSKSRTQLRLVGIATVLGLGLFFVAFADYLAPLNSPSGQLIVAVALAVLGSCVLWIARLSSFPVKERVLDPRRALTQRTGARS